MKRKRWALLSVVVLLLASAAVVYHQQTSVNLDKLLWSELYKMEHVNKIKHDGMMIDVSYSAVMRKYAGEWKAIEEEMRKRGASSEEIKGVMAAARRHFGHYNSSDSYIYGVPVSAKRIYYRFQPVWIIGFGWGAGGMSGGEMLLTEPPNHVRVLAIQARKPYKQLGMHTCS